MFLKIELACLGSVIIWKYFILGLCDPIDPLVTIVLHDWLMASHKWWYFLKSIYYLLIISLSFLEESRIELFWSILFSYENSHILDLYLVHILYPNMWNCQGLAFYHQNFRHKSLPAGSQVFLGGGLTALEGRSDRGTRVFTFYLLPWLHSTLSLSFTLHHLITFLLSPELAPSLLKASTTPPMEIWGFNYAKVNLFCGKDSPKAA